MYRASFITFNYNQQVHNYIIDYNKRLIRDI